MTIRQARKFLGKKHKDMTDDEIQKLIENLEYIAKHSLDKARKDNLEEISRKNLAS